MSEDFPTAAAARLLSRRLGRVVLTPRRAVIAGEIGEWTLTYTVGAYGIDEGGTIKIARRFASDWERPQFDAPDKSGYTAARTDGEARLVMRYDEKAGVRPWMKCVVIDIIDGSLAAGDKVTVVFGDRSGGGPGMRAQTFAERRCEMRVLVDPTNACLVRRLPTSPVFAIVPGKVAALRCIAPTRLRVGKPARFYVDGIDAWGNPQAAPKAVKCRWDGGGDARLRGLRVTFQSPGCGRIIARLRGRDYPGNPMRATADAPPPGRYWCDLHAQSGATVGTGSEREYFDFGRRLARLDVISHQGNDFQMDDADWRRLGAAVREFNDEGRYVVFPGFEWSGNTPAGGDRNVIYLDDNRPMFRSCHWQVPQVAEDEASPAHPASALFAKLMKRCDPERVLVAAHCGGRYADIRRHHHPRLERLVEVCSCWGVFEWLLWDAFARGARVGVMCNSDGHKGRPGYESPGAGQFGIFGGLTCVLAESLTRKAVFAALRARRCYGTTGARIDLDVNIGGAQMGGEIKKSGRIAVYARVHTAAPWEAIELYAGKELAARVRPAAFASAASSRRIRVWWGGAKMRGRGRRAIWDGEITASGTAVKIIRAVPFAFDAPLDGVALQSPRRLKIRSRTTGDIDGVDLYLSDARRGALCFSSAMGRLDIDLAALGDAPISARFGGLDLRAGAMRYPESLSEREGELNREFNPPPATTTPLMIKVIQEDGQMAWASPVYASA